MTHASTGDFPQEQVVLVQSPVESLLFSFESQYMQSFVCVLWDWSLFPPVLWKSNNQIPLAFKVRFPGDFQSLLSDPQAGMPDVGFRTFTTVGKLLWYYCSPVCGSPTWWVWDLILSIMPLLSPCCSFFFVFGHGVSFFGGFQHLPVNGCSTASCNFGAFHRRRWAHVLRLCRLEQETLVNNF